MCMVFDYVTWSEQWKIQCFDKREGRKRGKKKTKPFEDKGGMAGARAETAIWFESGSPTGDLASPNTPDVSRFSSKSQGSPFDWWTVCAMCAVCVVCVCVCWYSK